MACLRGSGEPSSARSRTAMASWYQRTATRDVRLDCDGADMVSSFRAVDPAVSLVRLLCRHPGLVLPGAVGRSVGSAERARQQLPAGIRLEAYFPTGGCTHGEE